ncbi:MAG: hypothetical protein GY749_27395 [Desulfobacteraceae bacterium]|nr:hypothetical protein [Desulfobacteraceae bacterium]
MMKHSEKSRKEFPVFEKQSLVKFCKDNGFQYSTVTTIIHRYMSKNPIHKAPRGKLTIKILENLIDYFELDKTEERKSA